MSQKVAYRLPGEDNAQYVDLYNALYRLRMLFLAADLDDELSNQICGIMIYLTVEDAGQDIYLFINSPGGRMTCGLSVIDIMTTTKSRIHTLGMGMAASMAALILAAGTPGCRIGFPHGTYMLHQPIGQLKGQAEDVIDEQFEMDVLRKRCAHLYSEYTGESVEQVLIDMKRDDFYHGREGLQYGSKGLFDVMGIEPSDKGSLNNTLPYRSQSQQLSENIVLPADDVPFVQGETEEVYRFDPKNYEQQKPDVKRSLVHA